MSPRALLLAAVFSAAFVVGAQQDQLLRADKLREATALLNQFFAERKIAGRDPVSKYLPEFAEAKVRAPNGATRPPSRDVNIDDLLLHTSGLNHRTSESYRSAQVRSRSIDLPQFIRNIVRVALMEDPGTVYRYSEATTVLGRLVEVWSGKPFDVFLNERVLRPLGMNDTTFDHRRRCCHGSLSSLQSRKGKPHG